MNDRFSQDAADALVSLEAIAAQRSARGAAFRAAVLARWAEAQPSHIVGAWAPTITEQERQEREAQIAAGFLPF